MPDEVGLIGIGLLGSAIAERLLAAGKQVLGFDCVQERRRWLTSQGGATTEDLQSIAAACSQIVLALPDSNIVQSVLAELAGVLRPETIILDTTTGSPQHAEQAAATLASWGVHYGEVTIAGSSEQVRKGEALAIIGADSALLPRIERLVAVWTRRAIAVGPPGQAARMKLTVNLALGLHRVVLAEALAFADAQGLSQQLALDVLRAGPSWSAVMDSKGQKMLAADYEPQARLRQHLKDVRIILEEAHRLNVSLPLSELHETLLGKAVAMNLGELDNSAIRLLYDALRDALRDARKLREG